MDRGNERPAADFATSTAEEIDPLQTRPVIGFVLPGEVLIKRTVNGIGRDQSPVPSSRAISLRRFVGFNEGGQRSAIDIWRHGAQNIPAPDLE
jgi:hypothetical protein